MRRKHPREHSVRGHTKSDGTIVRPYRRGSGTLRRVSRLVGRGVPRSLTETDIESWFSVVHGDSNDIYMETAMTGYRDEVSDVTYDDLVNILGAPSVVGSPDGKTRVDWVIKIGTDLVTIYDYKEYKTPLEEVTDWTIGGGASQKDINRIKKYVVKKSEQRRKK